MVATTIKLQAETKSQLDGYREYKNESYDEVIRKLIYIAKSSKTNPSLSKQTIEDIERARRRIRQGLFATEAEAKKRLGL